MASVQFGNYQILRKIGAGGMAQVFEAQRVGLEGFSRRVALKCILPEMTRDSRFVEMFVNEARLGSQLHHPNIVEIQDFNKVNDVYYIAMEYVEGVDLGDVISRFRDEERAFPPGLAIDIMLQALDGLGYAHEATTDDGAPMNIIHRDIKPSNLMLTNRGTVKIADFGIAKAATNAYQTRTAEVTKGSLAYMAPEQITREAPVSPASDLFSLGAVLFEMLQLRALFDGDNMPSIMFKVAQVEIERDLTELARHYPQFVPILERALARDVAYRYSRASEMAEDLRAIRHLFPEHPTIKEIVEEFIKPHSSEEDEVGENTIALLGFSSTKHPDEPTNLAALELRPPNMTPPPAPVGTNPGMGDTLYLSPEQRLGVQHPGERDSQPSLSVGPGRKRRRVLRFAVWGTLLLAALLVGLMSTGNLEVVPQALTALMGGRPTLLTIKTTPPGARIYLDGVPQERVVDGRTVAVVTPAKLRLSDDGIALIMVEKEGYEPYEETVKYEPGTTISLAPVLVKQAVHGTLVVESNPPGARVILNDKPTDMRTPARFDDLDASRPQVLRLELDGYVPYTSVTPLKKDDVTTVSAVLEPKPAQPPVSVASKTERKSRPQSPSSADGQARSDTSSQHKPKPVAKADTATSSTERSSQEPPNRPPPATPKPVTGPPGTLVVNCLPKCYVYVDDMPRIRAPNRVSLPPGKHRVRYETYDGSDRHTFTVTISPNQEVTRVWDWNQRKFLTEDD